MVYSTTTSSRVAVIMSKPMKPSNPGMRAPASFRRSGVSAALLTGKYLGWVWMDPLMGVVGACIIARWSFGLVRDTSRVLLDGDVEPELAENLRRCIERHADNRIVDLHLWRVGPQQLSVIISLVTHEPLPPEHYKQLLDGMIDLSHVTVEVNRCPGETCATAQ